MSLKELYIMAEQENIDVFSFPIRNKKAFCINDNGNKLIVIHYEKISSDVEEREILAEEIAHLKYGLLYRLTDDKNFIEEIERQAKHKAPELLMA